MAAPKWVFSNGKFQLAGKPQVPGDGQPVAPTGPAHQKVGGKNILTWLQEQYAAINKTYAENIEKGIEVPETWISGQQGLVNGIVEMYNQEVLVAGERTDAKTLADAKLAATAAENAAAGRGAASAETLRKKIAAEKKIADEETRQRGMAGTEAAAKSYEKSGGVVKGIYETAGAATGKNYKTAGITAQEKAMETIKKLYGGMDEKNAEDLRVALEQLGVDVESAKTNVSKAGADFLSGYNPSKAYETAPVMQESVGANPLLDSLRSQGADTSEVTAATADSNATLQQFAAFQKWANQNLNTGQQNFDAGMKNVSGQATAAGLQGIAARQPVINSGIKQDYSGYQQTINQGRSEATTAADAALAEAMANSNAAIVDGQTKGSAAMADAQGKADAARAEGMITYGVPPAQGSAAANANTAKDAAKVYPNFKAALADLHPNRPKQSLAKDQVKFSKLYASFKKV